MSNKAYVGKRTMGLRSSPEFSGYSKVVITAAEGVEYSAGTDTGRTLHLSCPWATQVTADSLLQSIQGFQYQPYAATRALLDPAVELGDGITIDDLYSGVYTLTTHYGGLCRADVAAPSDEEVDHEYPYVARSERLVQRRDAQLLAELRVNADAITAEVRARTSETAELRSTLKVLEDTVSAEVTARRDADTKLSGALSVQADEIAAKVSRSGGNESSTFGWDLQADQWRITGNGKDILKATSAGLEVFGKITATSGRIGGFDIVNDSLSYNNHTFNGTNTRGVYIGPQGIQLGANFKVDASGNLTAASGVFNGSVKASNIVFGEGNQLNGSALVSGTVSIPQLSPGIQASIDYVGVVQDYFSGAKYAPYLNVTHLQIFGVVPGTGGRYVKLKPAQITYRTADDKVSTVNLIAWEY